MSRLIINADDFGLTEGVTRGILDCHRSGPVCSTSALMTAEHSLSHLRRASRFSATLGLAVHLNMTYGRPVSDPADISSLVDRQGRFTSLRWKRKHPMDLDPEEVSVEWSRQINRFLQSSLTLDHLDCHHFVAGLTDEIWRVYLDLARHYGCGLRPLPNPGSPSPYDGDHRNISPTNASRLNREIRERGIASPDHFISDFHGPAATKHHLLDLIRHLPSGTVEIMTHPGYVGPGLISSSGYTHERQLEADILTDEEVKTSIAEHGIELVNYRGAFPP